MNTHLGTDAARTTLGLPSGTITIRRILSDTWGTQHIFECTADDQPFRWTLEGCNHFEQINRLKVSLDVPRTLGELTLYEPDFVVLDTPAYEISVRFARSRVE